MDFLKNISASLSKAAEVTTKKASELTDTAKLKVKQNRITSDINNTYTEIGKLIYKQYKESGDESAAIAELCLAIDKSNEELDAVNAEIEAIKAALEAMTRALLERYGDLPLVYAGGVMSCSLIKNELKAQFDCGFAEPKLSSDNAVGIAELARRKYISGR